MLGWINPRVDQFEAPIDHEFVASRIPSPTDFYQFICEQMRIHRRLRIIGDFEGAYQIVSLAYAFANRMYPLQLNVIMKNSSNGTEFEVSWIETPEGTKRYNPSEHV